MDEIYTADFNLSANRHRSRNRTKVERRDQPEILAELRVIETEILEDIDEPAEAVPEALLE